MADLLLSLLCAYGLAFLVQNKLWRPQKLHWLIEKLLSCIYCLGFWSGLFLFVARAVILGTEAQSLLAVILDAMMFGFASSVFCYSLDTAVQWLEERR